MPNTCTHELHSATLDSHLTSAVCFSYPICISSCCYFPIWLSYYFVTSHWLSDPDHDQSIAYRLVDPTDTTLISTTTGLLEISPYDGTVRVSSGVSLGSTPRTFDVVVGCMDSGSPALEVLVDVTVTLFDTNKPPEFAEEVLLFKTLENSPAGTNVGAVVATDSNAEDVVTYALIGETTTSTVTLNSTFSNHPVLFAIHPTSGQLTTKANGALLNHERISSVVVVVEARDNGFGQLRTTTEVTVLIEDRNEAPLALTTVVLNSNHQQTPTFYVAENAAVGTWVGNVQTQDPDGDALVYRVINGGADLPALPFRVSTGGDVYVAGPGLDYETAKEHALEVQVEDDGVPSLSTTFAVSIVVLNTNDRPTIFAEQRYTISENQPSRFKLGNPLQWQDEDASTTTGTTTGGSARTPLFSIQRVGCFSVTVPTSNAMVHVPTPKTMRPTFLNFTTRISETVEDKTTITLEQQEASKSFRITLGANGNSKTIVEHCVTHSTTNVVCSPVATAQTPGILKGRTTGGGLPTWILIELTNTSLTVFEKVRSPTGGSNTGGGNTVDHNPVVAGTELLVLVHVPLQTMTAPNCVLESGMVFALDAQCNAAERPDEEWVGRAAAGHNGFNLISTGTLEGTSAGTASIDMKNVEYFSEEGGYYHFNQIIKNVPTTLNPSTFPELSVELYFRSHQKVNNRGWIVCSDDRRGGYDRGIALHDSRFGSRPCGIAGKTYRST